MNSAIWKFHLSPGSNVLVMPKGSRFLSVGEQNDELYVWCRVDPNYTENHGFEYRVICTGEQFEENEKVFAGTVMMKNGLVLHVYLDSDLMLLN